MDLSHDWKSLNDIVFPKENTRQSISEIVLIEDDDTVVDGVVSNGKAYTDVGLTQVSKNKEKLDAISSQYGVERAVIVSKKALDQSIIDAATLGTNYFQQLEMIRACVLKGNTNGGAEKKPLVVNRKHFFLDIFRSPIRFFLPRRFNVLIFVDDRPLYLAYGQPSFRAILLSYAHGKLDQFFEPDFSSLHENRLVDWLHETTAVGQYLESRYLLPCYGVLIQKEDWEFCVEVDRMGRRGAEEPLRGPWSHLVKCIDEKRAVIYPNKVLFRVLVWVGRILSWIKVI
ncbi:MAG: hypothetical protein AB7F43_05185 [Bacteriovoracia bacterium]